MNAAKAHKGLIVQIKEKETVSGRTNFFYATVIMVDEERDEIVVQLIGKEGTYNRSFSARQVTPVWQVVSGIRKDNAALKGFIVELAQGKVTPTAAQEVIEMFAPRTPREPEQ